MARRWGQGSLRKRGKYYWADFTDASGVRRRESTGCTHKEDAVGWLRDRQLLAQSPNIAITVEDLSNTLVKHYSTHGKPVQNVKEVLSRIKPSLGKARASSITPARLLAYVQLRKTQNTRFGRPPTNATINRELAYIRRMFVVGKQYGLVDHVPTIQHLAEQNIRTGFFTIEEYQRVKKHLPDYLQPVFDVAYITGWRTQSEILTRQWHHVSLDETGYLRLDPHETKNGEGRVFPMIPALRTVLEAQKVRKDALEAAGTPVQAVFFHYESGHGVKAGDEIMGYQRAWRAATKAAGLSRIAHDFRRTAVMNLIQAGVSQHIAMRLVGHRTDAVFRRYSIPTDIGLWDGANKYQLSVKL